MDQSRRKHSSPRSRLGPALTVGVAVGFALALGLQPVRADEALDRSGPAERPTGGYVTSAQCASCHPASHASWRASFHRTMTQRPGPQAIQAPFDGVVLERGNERVHLSRRDDRYWADFRAPDPRDPQTSSDPVRREIVLATGSHHFQVYWMPTGEGREIELFPFTYQIDEQRWIETDHLVLSDPRRAKLYSIWNKHCIQCHATGAKPRLRLGSDTEVGEFGIACEACHGPGEAHVEINRDPTRRYGLHLSGDADPSIVNPARLPHDRSAQVCGQCHSVNTFHSREATRTWSRDGFPYRPGDDLNETRRVFHGDADLSLGGETSFWPDDMVRVNGREYNSLLKTPCFERGELDCLSCHSLHRDAGDERPLEQWADDQLRPGMRGNRACTQCHSEFDGDAKLSAHTRHGPDSAGSRCYDCHMPNTAYGLHKATRSHQVTSPSVADEVANGRPNACNLCHLNRSQGWTARHLKRNWKLDSPELNDAQRHLAAGAVWALSGDAGLRVLAAWHMGWAPAREASGSDWFPPYLAQLLVDPYPAVRSVAIRSLRSVAGYQDVGLHFEDPKDERQATRERVLERWHRTRPAGQRGHFPTLIRPGGGLDEALFADLLKRRDRRFIWLLE
jgi:hypothetical protein